MGFMQAATVHTLKGNVAAGAASDTAGSGRASGHPSWVSKSPPRVQGKVVASVAMMSKVRTV